MTIKLYTYAALAVILMGLSWYAYSTTKALGAAKLANKTLKISLDEQRKQLAAKEKALVDNRRVHNELESHLRTQLRRLSNVPHQKCFDDPVPDTAANVVLNLPGIRRSMSKTKPESFRTDDTSRD